MKKLTRKKAIELCIELWEWCAETGELKGSWPGWEKYGEVRSDCWFCEYSKQQCLKYKIDDFKNYCRYCLFEKGNFGCLSTPYFNWEAAKTKKTRKKYAALFLAQIKTLIRGKNVKNTKTTKKKVKKS